MRKIDHVDSQTFPTWRIYPYSGCLILNSHTKKLLSSPCVSVKNPHDGHEYQEGDAGQKRVWFQTAWQEYNLLNKRAIWSIDGSIELLGQQLKKEPFVLAFAKDGGQTTSFISTSWRYYAKLREFSTIGVKPSFQSRSWGVMMLKKWVKGLNRKKTMGTASWSWLSPTKWIPPSLDVLGRPLSSASQWADTTSLGRRSTFRTSTPTALLIDAVTLEVSLWWSFQWILETILAPPSPSAIFV